ncbi:hypothetical protein K1719_013080 [Acacia pycnantha]|nr:hypothetical protein K1719_013080 [Acacia pycnantha]
MGGVCSRKRDQDSEDSSHRRLSRRYCNCGSLKWLNSSFSYPSIDYHLQKGERPSLLDLCIWKICENIQSKIQGRMQRRKAIRFRVETSNTKPENRDSKSEKRKLKSEPHLRKADGITETLKSQPRM